MKSMRWGIYVTLIVGLISFYNAHGQIEPDATTDYTIFNEIDSLNTVALMQLKVNLSSAKETAKKANHLALQNNRIQAYIQSTCILSEIMANTTHCREALEILKQAELQAVKESDSLGMGLLASAKGKCYYYLALYDSSKIFHENAIDIFQRINENTRLASEYIQLTRVYLKSGDTKRAASYYSKANNEQQKFANEEDFAWNKDALGELYHAQRLYDQAIAEFKGSQKEFEKLNNRKGFASASLHIGNSFYMKVEDDSTKKYYNLALTTFQLLGDSNGIAICYTNLSRLALEGGHHQQAIDLANKSIATIHGGDYKLIETATLQQLGDIYLELEQYETAIQHITKALEIARQIHHKVTIMDCYKSLSEIYSAMRKPDLAYSNLLLAYRLKDSIQPIAFSKQLAEMQDQLETQKRENQITLLEQANKIKSLEISEKSNQITRRNIFILLGILIVTLIGIVVYISAQKEKFKNRVEKEFAIKSTEESERMRFARDVHDDLGSGLTKINFLSELIASGRVSEKDIRENATGISETSKSLIENMRDLIWALNPENSTLENLLASIREYTSDYLEEYPASLVMNIQVPEEAMTITRESHREIFLTVKECLNNIVKHSRATRIELDASIYNNLLFISLNDNGVGMNENMVGKGNGLNNMRNRIETISGLFTFENAPGCGTLMSITIGLEKIVKAGK
ncbi:MAG: tetratricopeptide repeat protein [Bacteroidetes bacterium]|nr:tetratricopeptide repeat protein [Bacteroidota bacterium]